MEINSGRVIINRKRKTKTKTKTKHDRVPESHVVFPLLLAALMTKSQNSEAIVKKCLRLIFITIPNFLSAPVLSLIPSLLKSKSTEIVCVSADVVGAASLFSFEMNEKIALEDEIIKSLIFLLGSSAPKISMAACNAMLDLSTTSVGRLRFLEFFSIENLICCFIQAYKSHTVEVSVFADVILYTNDEHPILLLHIAIILINSCTIERLKNVPSDLSESFVVHLKRWWGMINKKRSYHTSPTSDWQKGFRTSNIKTNELAESIFRLSIVCDERVNPMASDLIKKRIFRSEETGVEQFLSNSWELSPLLIKNSSHASERQDDIFSTFTQFLGLIDEVPRVTISSLRYCIHCPPMESNELDVLQILDEVKHQLGCHLIYNQDIRVVKTERGKGELHYFKNIPDSNGSMDNFILHIDDMFKLEEAFKDGYSIALRGMEFRFQTIDGIADALASLFGQPSVGANMYLTPCNSQGLARHSDDHCVFVCQLFGAKRWTVFPRPQLQLPRLYTPLDSLPNLNSETLAAGEQFLLKRGDVLYIPRGCPHEAQTYIQDDKEYNGTAVFSLHLTLSIEIEPPFEWEGFLHIALHSWWEKHSTLPCTSLDSVPLTLHFATMKLLHVAIIMIGNNDPTFRKACLIGSTLLSSIPENGFQNLRKAVFTSLVSKIATESKFSNVLEHMDASLNKNEDPLEQVRWMKDIAFGQETDNWSNLSILSAESASILTFSNEHRGITEDEFQQSMMRFCKEVEFEDVEVQYKMLLDKYRKVRKQYSDGMLSLHSVLNGQTN